MLFYFIVSKVKCMKNYLLIMLAYYLLIPSTKGYDENNLFTHIKDMHQLSPSLIRPSE